MSYKAIIFDLDGTAIPNKPDGMPSPALIDAAACSSLKLCAATGRPYSSAHSILRQLNLTEPCVLSAGTQIVRPTDGTVLWQVNMDDADVSMVLRIAAPYPYEVIWQSELVGTGAPAAQRKNEKEVNVIYIMACRKKDAETMMSKLTLIKGITASPVRSWTQHGIDIHITSSEATKEHAVEELLRMINLCKEEVIGVGDGDNDIHLFRSVGYRVAMRNATDNLKLHADEVCPSVEEDGLARVINKYSQ